MKYTLVPVDLRKAIPAFLIKESYGTYSLHFINPDGRRRRLSVGKDLQTAQRLSVKFTDWLMEGKDPEREHERTKNREQAHSITIKEFYPKFFERHGRMPQR